MTLLNTLNFACPSPVRSGIMTLVKNWYRLLYFFSKKKTMSLNLATIYKKYSYLFFKLEISGLEADFFPFPDPINLTQG
jgi:hypothetical protein